MSKINDDTEYFEMIKEMFLELSNDERLEIMSYYCRFCGKDTTEDKCYCAPIHKELNTHKIRL